MNKLKLPPARVLSANWLQAPGTGDGNITSVLHPFDRFGSDTAFIALKIGSYMCELDVLADR